MRLCVATCIPTYYPFDFMLKINIPRPANALTFVQFFHHSISIYLRFSYFISFSFKFNSTIYNQSNCWNNMKMNIHLNCAYQTQTNTYIRAVKSNTLCNLNLFFKWKENTNSCNFKYNNVLRNEKKIGIYIIVSKVKSNVNDDFIEAAWKGMRKIDR